MLDHAQERGPVRPRLGSGVGRAVGYGIVGLIGSVLGVFFYGIQEIMFGAALLLAVLGLLARGRGQTGRAFAVSSVALLVGITGGMALGPAITDPVGTDQGFSPPIIETVALTLLALACGLLALTGAPLFEGRTARIALGTLAVGMLSFVIAANAPVRADTNPAMSLQIAVGYGVSLLAILVGYGATVVSILGPTRWAALILPIGLLLIFAPWLPPIVVLALVAYHIVRYGR